MRFRRRLLVTVSVSTFVLALFAGSRSRGAEPKETAAKEIPAMTAEQASAFAKLALKGLQKEFPNKPGEVLNGADDVKTPRTVHPAFYGSFDWHSSVHGHW